MRLTDQHSADHDHAAVLLEESRSNLLDGLSTSNGGNNLAVGGDVVEHERSAAGHHDLIETSSLAGDTIENTLSNYGLIL